MKNEEVIYFESPKVGIFSIETHKYNPETGWVRKEVEYTIIGTIGDDFYVYNIKRLHPDHGLNGIKPKPTMTDSDIFIPLSIHKKRFVKWKNS